MTLELLCSTSFMYDDVQFQMFSCKSSCPLWLDSTIFSFCASHFHLFLFGWAPLQKFHNLVTVNSSMVNAEMQSSLACSAFGSFMVYQEVGELDRGEVLSAVFRGPSILVSLVAALILIPTTCPDPASSAACMIFLHSC